WRTASDIDPGPPRMTMSAGCSRVSSAPTEAGTLVLGTNRIGLEFIPATGAPANASGKFVPDATYTVEAGERKLAPEIPAAFAYPSAPASRLLSPLVAVPIWGRTAADIDPGPPSTTMSAGCSRVSSASTEAGTLVLGTNKIGVELIPATGAPA